MEECVDLSSELRRRIFKCPVEEAAIWWWQPIIVYSSRQKYKFSSLSVAFSGLLVTYPCLNFCLSFTINFSEGVWYGDPTCTPHRPWNLSLDSLSLSISGGMCRFEFRIEEADF